MSTFNLKTFILLLTIPVALSGCGNAGSTNTVESAPVETERGVPVVEGGRSAAGARGRRHPRHRDGAVAHALHLEAPMLSDLLPDQRVMSAEDLQPALIAQAQGVPGGVLDIGEQQRHRAIQLAWLLTHDAAVAEDIVQDAVLTTLTKLRSGES